MVYNYIVVMALFELNLDVPQTYKDMVNQYFALISTYLFMIILEPLDKFNVVSMLFYNLLGMLFYNLVVKEIIVIR